MWQWEPSRGTFPPRHLGSHNSVGGDQAQQKSGRGVPLCVGPPFQFTGSPCSFTISPVIKGNQPRNYQSVNCWDAAKQIQLLIEAHWPPLRKAAVIRTKPGRSMKWPAKSNIHLALKMCLELSHVTFLHIYQSVISSFFGWN